MNEEQKKREKFDDDFSQVLGAAPEYLALVLVEKKEEIWSEAKVELPVTRPDETILEN